MWNSDKFDDSWTIKLAVFVVSLNSEGKSMCSDQYLKSCGWTRSLSTLFASFHFIHSQLFVGSFQIRFRWNIFVPSCSFSYIEKMQTSNEIMRAWFLEEKKSYSSMLSFFLEIKPNKCTEIGWSLNTEVLVWVPWVLCLVTTVLTCNILRVFLGKNMIWFFLVIDGLDFNIPGSKYCLLMTISNPCKGRCSEKSCCSFGFCPIFCHLFLSAFLVN